MAFAQTCCTREGELQVYSSHSQNQNWDRSTGLFVCGLFNTVLYPARHGDHRLTSATWTNLLQHVETGKDVETATFENLSFERTIKQ
jgi:hypothetical protein